MVMHPSPGHYSGTLVNALLHHCGLPAMQLTTGEAPPLSLGGALNDPSSHGSGGGSSSSNSESGEGEGEGELGSLESEDDDDASSLVLTLPQPAPGLLPPSLQQQGLQQGQQQQQQVAATIRPGIVHRLDKGTTGLLVVAKDDPTHLSLAAQVRWPWGPQYKSSGQSFGHCDAAAVRATGQACAGRWGLRGAAHHAVLGC